MSGIAGSYSRDGARADRALVERMLKRLEHRGPDGSSLWCGESVALGHLAFHTTEESLRERQPLADASGTRTLVLDGRVDNRTELHAALLARGCVVREDTDAELILQSYLCWGAECPAHILGDFAFAIWDQASEQLFCARDVLGMKPFYYCLRPRWFTWSSELRALFEHDQVSRTPNEAVIAQNLCSTLSGNEETIFRDILRLPPGHSLVVRRDGVRLRRYWDVTPETKIRYRTDAEYAEHFRTIFREAVRCRMRSHLPVAAELSGGVDSSSVVGMAQSLYADGTVPARGFETFSLVFPGKACDERPYVEDVVRHWGLTANYLEPMLGDRSFYHSGVERDFELPIPPNGTMSIPMARSQADRGMRVLLDGNGGDEWFTGNHYHYADLWRGMRFVALARRARDDRKVRMMHHPGNRVIRSGLWPLLPLALRMWLRRVLRRDGRPPSFFGPKLACQLPPAQDYCREFSRNGFAEYSLAAMYRQVLHNPVVQQGNEDSDRFRARLGIDLRSPFYDRRLIEFAFALPEEQRWQGGQTKFILREATAPLLPASVVARTDKVDFSYLTVETLRGTGADPFARKLVLEDMGWVKGDSVREMYRTMLQRYDAGDARFVEFTWPLWLIFGLEMWLNKVVVRG